MKNIAQIETENETQWNIVVSVLRNRGFALSSEMCPLYKAFVIYDNRTISGNPEACKGFGKDFTFSQLEAFYDYLTEYFERPTEIKVKLNDEYSATVTKDKITVGCQVFDAAILDDLLAARNKLV